MFIFVQFKTNPNSVHFVLHIGQILLHNLLTSSFLQDLLENIIMFEINFIILAKGFIKHPGLWNTPYTIPEKLITEKPIRIKVI